MSKIYFGKTTMTHGIKGELKCYTDFEKKELVLKNKIPIYINNQKHVISTSRPHQNHYLITIDNLLDINLVEEFRNKAIYIERSDLNLEENDYLIEDLIGMNVKEGEELLGKVTDIRYNKGGLLLHIKNSSSFYIPYQDNFIDKVDLEKETIYVKNAKGLML